MSNEVKKRILISPELASAQLGFFFLELGYELCQDFDESIPGIYAFIVDDFLPELKKVPRLQTKPEIVDECRPYVRAYFKDEFFGNSDVLRLLKIYFEDTASFDLIDRYSKNYRNVFNFKIHDYLNVGYFIDTVVVEAYKNGFAIDAIRNYLNFALPYCLKQLEKINDLSPLDVSFSCSDEGFTVQLSLNSVGINLKNELYPDQVIFADLAGKTNCFDISYYKKRNRVVLTSLWFKSEELKSFRSHFFTEISYRTGNSVSLINILDEQNEAIEFKPAVAQIETVPEKILVTGKSDVATEVQRVLGSRQLEDFQALKIEGSQHTEEEWKAIIPQVTQKIKEEIIKINSANKALEASDIASVIKNEIIETNPEVVKIFASNILEEVQKNIVVKEPVHDAYKVKLENQLLRMKNIMDQMKVEISKLRAEVKSRREVQLSDSISEEGESTEEIVGLKKSLAAALENLRTKERMAEKFKNDVEQIISAKDIKIETLESRLESSKDDYLRSKEFANEEKLEVLTAENKSLHMRLELANRKINIISSNMEKQESGSNVKKDKEIANLKSSVQMAQVLIEKIKEEKSEVEARLTEEKEKYSKLRDEKGSVEANSRIIIEKDKQIALIMAEKKTVEEKLKVQAIEIKKVEQKLKFTAAQLEESQRKKGTQGSQSGAKSNDIYIKQLEYANNKLAETSADLSEKKKELLKLKQDNALLTTKNLELEKKLGNMDKKAS